VRLCLVLSFASKRISLIEVLFLTKVFTFNLLYHNGRRKMYIDMSVTLMSDKMSNGLCILSDAS
jgi:hypothetical protein